MLGCCHILAKAAPSSAAACRRAPSSASVAVTGFHCTSARSPSLLLTSNSSRTCQRAHHHTWITGHPHRIAFNNSSTSATTAANPSASHQACSTGTTAGAGAAGGASASFVDFTGNSRFLANHLARFSTFSAVSSSSTFTSSLSPPASSLSSSFSTSTSTATSPRPESSPSQAQQDAGSGSGSGSSSAQTKFGTSASGASSAPSTPSASSSASQASQAADDKDDDAWAVNESYMGHGGIPSSSESVSPSQPVTSSSKHASENASDDDRINQSNRASSAQPLADATSNTSSNTPSPTTTTPSNNDMDNSSQHQNDQDEEDQHSSLRPSYSSFKDAASIEKSWRRTSAELPSNSPSNSSSVPRPSHAGNLDLSSSTLVQQMLFGDRRSHDDSSNTHADQATATETVTNTTSTQESSPSLQELINNAGNNATQSSGTATPSSPKKDKKENNGNNGEETEEHIAKLDICVGIVRSVEKHPDAESLYVEQIDVGDVPTAAAAEDASSTPPTTRTIVSGLVKYIPKDYLEGRAVIVVRNMKPSKLRGIASHGMLLCGMEKDADGTVTKVELLEPAEGSQAGEKVIFEGFTDESTLPVPVLTPKRKWFEKTQVHFSVQDGIAFYKGSPFKTVRGLVRCRSINKGEIS